MGWRNDLCLRPLYGLHGGVATDFPSAHSTVANAAVPSSPITDHSTTVGNDHDRDIGSTDGWTSLSPVAVGGVFGTSSVSIARVRCANKCNTVRRPMVTARSAARGTARVRKRGSALPDGPRDVAPYGPNCGASYGSGAHSSAVNAVMPSVPGPDKSTVVDDGTDLWWKGGSCSLESRSTGSLSSGGLAGGTAVT